MKPLHFALIGCGSLARMMHLPNLLKSDRASVEICCDLDDRALAECREKFGVKRTSRDWREAIRDPDVDAICLATTEKLRLPVIEAAAEAGKPIYVEKPLAATLADLYAIQKVVHQAKILMCVGHNRRSSPAMIDAHRIFRAQMDSPVRPAWVWDREGSKRPTLPEEGTPGVSVRINDDNRSWKAWVYDKTQAPHGPMLFEMSHFTDICNWFLAAEPLEVFALETGMYNHGVIIRYDNGAVATIHMCANGTHAYPKELYEAMGNGCIVAVDHMVEVRTAGIDGVPTRMTYPMLGDRHPKVGTEGGIAGWLAKRHAACDEAAAKGDPLLQFTAEPDKGHARALDRFVDEIRGTGPMVCGVDDAVRATRVSFASLRSAAERRIVPLSEI